MEFTAEHRTFDVNSYLRTVRFIGGYVSVWMNFFWLIHNSNKFLEKNYANVSQVSCIFTFFVIYESIA
ncbi:hypothetical protein C0J52_28260 [Blattella germanica]|nr:hypothetical protein C0J52_28260 [Blattella germanica]